MDIYQREFLALRERLHSAEQENLRRSKELNLVLEEIKRAIAEKQALRDINRTWSSLSGLSTLTLHFGFQGRIYQTSQNQVIDEASFTDSQQEKDDF